MYVTVCLVHWVSGLGLGALSIYITLLYQGPDRLALRSALIIHSSLCIAGHTTQRPANFAIHQLPTRLLLGTLLAVAVSLLLNWKYTLLTKPTDNLSLYIADCFGVKNQTPIAFF